MAFRLTLFNSPKPRVFTYRPLYFDPEKEKWEQRRAQFHAKEGAAPSATDLPTKEERLFYRDPDARPGSGIRGSFQRTLIESRRHSVENKYLRIVVLLSILALFLVAIYLSDGLGYLFRAMYTQPLP